jgi:dTDP-4-dehydrorhamnose 3,5-epimerase
MNIPPYYQPAPEQEAVPGIFRTKIEGLFYLKYKKFLDERGFFADITSLKNLEKVLGRRPEVKQINLAYSNTNVVRGLHAEGWNKLTTVMFGKGMSALVDIRPESKSFKQVEYFLFEPKPTDEFHVGLYVPMGVANSIAVIEGPLLYHYAVDAFYDERDAAGDKALSLFDPELNIQWPIEREKMILSPRDVDSATLQELLQKR